MWKKNGLSVVNNRTLWIEAGQKSNEYKEIKVLMNQFERERKTRGRQRNQERGCGLGRLEKHLWVCIQFSKTIQLLQSCKLYQTNWIVFDTITVFLEGLTFLRSLTAANSGQTREHRDLQLHKESHRMWPRQLPLSSYTSVRTCSTCLYEDHNIPLNLNRSFHLVLQLNITYKYNFKSLM